MKPLCWILLALLHIGCINDYLRPQATGAMVVDYSCTDEQFGVIRTKAGEWFRALPEAEAPIRRPRSGERSTVRCEHGPAPKIPGHDVLGTATPVLMTLWPEAAGPLFPNVVLHEMGHYLGQAQHPEGAAALAGASPSSWVCINEVDIESVCRARRGRTRGCRGATRPTC